MKKLSQAQAQVVDALLADEKRYIKPSGYFNEQLVTDGVQNGFYMQFKRSTLISLRDTGCIFFNKTDKTYRLSATSYAN